MGPWANFQYPIFGKSQRRTPDLSSNADPASGVYVYSGFNGGWFVVGGTSVSSPSLAGIVNRAGNVLGSVFLTPVTGGSNWFNTEENNLLYAQLATARAYKANLLRRTDWFERYASLPVIRSMHRCRKPTWFARKVGDPCIADCEKALLLLAGPFS